MKTIGKGTTLLLAVLFGGLAGISAADQTPKKGGMDARPSPAERVYAVQYHESSLEFLKAVQLPDGKILVPGTYQLRLGFTGRGPAAKFEFWQGGKLAGKLDGEAVGFPPAPAEPTFSFGRAGFVTGSRASLTPGPGGLVLRLQSSNSSAFFQAQLKLAPARCQA